MKNHPIAFSAITAIILLAVFSAAYVTAHFYIKNHGIAIKPSRDIETRSVTFHLQNDPRWAKKRIGQSESTIWGAGCLLACVSSAITAQGIDVTPLELNERLPEVGGFSGDRLDWSKLARAVPGVRYKYSRIFWGRTIQKDLDNDLLPVVNVRYHKTGITHWVLVVGAKDGEFMVLDPADRRRKPIPLSLHGKVYAYRVVCKD